MRFGKIDTRYGVGFPDSTLLNTANIPYSNQDYPDLLTMRAALDWLLALEDLPLSLQLDSLPPQELGASLNSVTLNWEVSPVPDNLLVNDINIDPTLTSYVYQGPFTSPTNFTVSAIRGGQAVSSTAQLAFNNRTYWGSLGVDSLDSFSIVDLFSEAIAKRQFTKNLSGNGGHLFLAWPLRYGEGQVKVNGMVTTAWTLEEKEITNHLGYAEVYLIYKSIYKHHGNLINVEVL